MVWKIFFKELKDTLRDRKTILLTIFVPIMMIAAMSLLYENIFLKVEESIPETKIGISDRVDDATLEWLLSLEHMNFVKVTDPQSAAIEGEVQIAMEIDPSFLNQLQSSKPSSITLYADLSSMKVSRGVDLLLRELGEKEQSIAQSRLVEAGVDPNHVKPFSTAVKSLTKGDDGSTMLMSMLFSLVIVMSVMLGGAPSATDLFAGEKERKTMESLLITPVSRIKLIVAKWLAISTLGTMSGCFSIIAFVLVTKTLTKKMAAALDFGDQTLLLLLSAIIGILFFAFLFATIQMTVSIVNKSFKEAQSYIAPVMFIAMVPYFLMVGLAPNELQSFHFIIPFMNIFALLKELIYGIFSVNSILLVAASSLLFIVIGFSLAYGMFKKDKWVLGK